jgi:hypothetical protein
MPYFFDTETCGLHGPIVLIQYALDDGPIILHEVWNEPINKTLKIIDDFMVEGIIGFNLTFDHFHLCQLYTTFLLLENKDKPPVIHEYAQKEADARFGPCLRPSKCHDIMLHARRGPYQTMMDRDEVRIKRVPNQLAWQLAQELETRLVFKDIYFERKKEKTETRWKIHDIEDNLNFKDLVLSFAPSRRLKSLAIDALGENEANILRFEDIEVHKNLRPVEFGYAPFNKAAGKDGWPFYLKFHIDHWHLKEQARYYAEKDVDYTRRLYYHFGSQPLGDRDSELACMVGAVRWRGYAVDLEGIRELKEEAKVKSELAPTAPSAVKRYISAVLNEEEKQIITSTEKVILEEMSKWDDHPAASRAREVLDARIAEKEIQLYDKLLKAGRFHASFNIIGALSGRMSGTDGLNPQGINKGEWVRSKFTFADRGMILCGGDFAAFEVALMEAVYKDPQLRADLLSGKKIHALLGMELFGKTYEEILETQGMGQGDLYTKGKQGVFALGYGGNAYTLQSKLGVEKEAAERAFENFGLKYPNIGANRKRYEKMFCTMSQVGGIGSRIIWNDPADYIENLLGFRRYFTLENRIAKTLFDLAEKPPKAWLLEKQKIIRRDREQLVPNAVRSALFASAFAIQAGNMRAAANHEIQSTGAELTKELQLRLWNLQPIGINPWLIQPMNIHDEIIAPQMEEMIPKSEQVVKNFVAEFMPMVPLLAIDWKSRISSWGDK